MKACVAPRISIPPEPFQGTDLTDEVRVDNCAFTNTEFSDEFLNHEFYECTFEKVTLSGSSRQVLYCDSVFTNCDFSNADLDECVFRRVSFVHCRLTGTDFSSSRFQDVSFENCEMRYANLSGSKFQQCRFQDCILLQAGFSSCTFKDVQIEHCDFTEAEFVETSLSGLDFSNSLFQGILINGENLKGVTVNEDQALLCVQLLGIHVKLH